MKDLEKIKSEDLGCQVADANPGNFAIEQEVAQLVGATVPAPTAPSADDARELGAQLLVFLRRALTPIRSALRTALAAIYAHLDSRCTDYTPAAYDPFRLPAGPYDPMRPLTPRTLPNLLTALTAFAPRKISNDANVPDGISLAHIAFSSDTDTVPIVDDNPAWDMRAVWPNEVFPYIGGKLVLNCKTAVIPTNTSNTWLSGTFPDGVLFRYLKTITGGYYHERLMNITTPLLDMPEFETTRQCRIGGTIGAINMPKFRRVLDYWAYQDFIDAAGVKTIHLPSFDYLNSCYHYDTAMIRCADVEHIILENWDGANSGSVNVLAKGCPELLDIDLSSCVTHAWNTAVNCPKLQRVKFGKVTTFTRGAQGGGNTNIEWDGCGALIDIEFADGVACNIDLGTWNPTDKGTTFLQNFKEHICQRLANRTGQTKLTLTLSADVYTAIMTDNDIKAELVARNWKVTDGTNNYNN